jgi:hypothetical protein
LGKAAKWAFGIGLPFLVSLLTAAAMKRFGLAALLALAMASGAYPDQPKSTPDTAKIISVSGRFSLAQACPVAPDIAITAAHVVDPRPFDRSTPAFPVRGESVDGFWTLQTWRLFYVEDLALMEPVEGKFPRFYQIAEKAPLPGERLWWMGYDFSNQKRAFQRREFSSEVLAVVAGLIILKNDTPQGTSGSCVLNSKGEVVGILSFGKDLDNKDSVTGVIGIWGNLLDLSHPKEEEQK